MQLLQNVQQLPLGKYGQTPMVVDKGLYE